MALRTKSGHNLLGSSYMMAPLSLMNTTYDLNIHAKIVINVLIYDNYLIQSTYNQLQTSSIILFISHQKDWGL